MAVPFSIEINEPLIRPGISPLYGSKSIKRWFIIASPAVAVRSWFLNPIIPLDGILNEQIMRPPFGPIATISPLRVVTISTAFPETSSGKSIVSSSIGSHFTPSISLMMTCG